MMIMTIKLYFHWHIFVKGVFQRGRLTNLYDKRCINFSLLIAWTNNNNNNNNQRAE